MIIPKRQGSPETVEPFMYNPPGEESAEFLEFSNNAGKAVNISLWLVEGLAGSTPEGERYGAHQNSPGSAQVD